MNDIDFTLCSVPMLYSRNKNKDYQERVINELTVLLAFMKANNLFERDPFNSDGSLNKEFILKKSETTADGVEMFKKVIPGWFSYLDKGGNIDNITRLEKGLEKIRKSV
ncbi:hypothetical protein BTW15_28360 [Pseudomonas syringae pv. tomato]|uniref:Uncharacterized protein n=3 Tax=Pseudomonas syringae group TaxID=136849 RepID=A0AAW4E795_PSESX|nr:MULTISPECIES: hypothetical protein [Pseudomonas syringae group]AVI87436.1 hypothetical protein XJ28_28890 [Pseudomonas syringae pv. tomato]EEB56815.1 hypothetical protein PSPTOT1_4717 [Pseudomonas syringae pv. tomato T1]KGK93282.1 hypothetical protein NB04_22030 [Pseudomonas syringae pv. tomato]KUR42322.1 hypothetical protein PSTA9_03345 [Pseudomonas syringae pv. tomato]KUR42377.1 hypothetical protein PST407_05630 [Pseudomonas syringae pv. tomato]